MSNNSQHNSHSHSNRYSEDDEYDEANDQFPESTQNPNRRTEGSMLLAEEPSAAALMANRLGSSKSLIVGGSSTSSIMAHTAAVIPGQDTTPGAYSVSREGDSALLTQPSSPSMTQLPANIISQPPQQQSTIQNDRPPLATLAIPPAASNETPSSPRATTNSNQQVSRATLERKLDQAEAQFMMNSEEEMPRQEEESRLPPIGMMALPSSENIIINVDKEQPVTTAHQQSSNLPPVSAAPESESPLASGDDDDDTQKAQKQRQRRRQLLWGAVVGLVLVAVLVIVLVVVLGGGDSDSSTSSSSNNNNNNNNGDNGDTSSTTPPTTMEVTTTAITPPTTTTSSAFTIFTQSNLFGCPGGADVLTQCINTTNDLRGSFDIGYDTTQLTITTTGDGALSLYVQRAVPPLEEVLPQDYKCSDTIDTSSALTTCTIAPAIAGTYHYLLRGHDKGFGQVTLRAAAAEPPPPIPTNNVCETATSLPSLSVTELERLASGTTNGATPEELTGLNCGINDESYSVWYSFTADASGTATVSLCGSAFDTHVAVLTGSACNQLQCVAQDDDGGNCGVNSATSVSVQAGNTYYIVVSGQDTATGNYQLRLFWEQSTLATTTAQGFGWSGNMFDIATKDRDIWITQLSLLRQAAIPKVFDAEVFTKTGNYSGFEEAASQWTLLHTQTVERQDLFFDLEPFSEPLRVPAGSFQAFYVRLDGSDLQSTQECCEGDLYVENSDLAIFTGNAVNGRFGNSFDGFVWNGAIQYFVPDP